jgi:hypothetical protein
MNGSGGGRGGGGGGGDESISVGQCPPEVRVC